MEWRRENEHEEDCIELKRAKGKKENSIIKYPKCAQVSQKLHLVTKFCCHEKLSTPSTLYSGNNSSEI